MRTQARSRPTPTTVSEEALAHRAVVRCVMSLKSREWHEDLIAAKLGRIMSDIGEKVRTSRLIKRDGRVLSPTNWTHASVIGTQTAIELDMEMRGGSDVE